MHLSTDTGSAPPCGERPDVCKLVVDGEVVSDPEVLLGKWAEHFSRLAQSRSGVLPGLAELQRKMDGLALESLGNDDMLLDVPFSADEVAAAVSKLKCRKAAGPDGLMAEHLTAGGENLALLPLLFSLLKLPVHHQQQLYYILRVRIVYVSWVRVLAGKALPFCSNSGVAIFHNRTHLRTSTTRVLPFRVERRVALLGIHTWKCN